MGGRGHPLEFRRKVLDLVEAGRPVADVARDLGGSTELEAELATHRRASELLAGVVPNPQTSR